MFLFVTTLSLFWGLGKAVLSDFVFTFMCVQGKKWEVTKVVPHVQNGRK